MKKPKSTFEEFTEDKEQKELLDKEYRKLLPEQFAACFSFSTQRTIDDEPILIWKDNAPEPLKWFVWKLTLDVFGCQCWFIHKIIWDAFQDMGTRTLGEMIRDAGDRSEIEDPVLLLNYYRFRVHCDRAMKSMRCTSMQEVFDLAGKNIHIEIYEAVDKFLAQTEERLKRNV